MGEKDGVREDAHPPGLGARRAATGGGSEPAKYRLKVADRGKGFTEANEGNQGDWGIARLRIEEYAV